MDLCKKLSRPVGGVGRSGLEAYCDYMECRKIKPLLKTQHVKVRKPTGTPTPEEDKWSFHFLSAVYMSRVKSVRVVLKKN